MDLSTIQRHGATSVDSGDVAVSGGVYRSSVEIPELERRDLFIGSAEGKARDALEVYRKAQEDAILHVVDSLERSYTIEIESILRDEQSNIQAEYLTWVDLEIGRLRSDFEAHASKTGPIRNDLAALVGFPDPDPRSIRVPPAHDKEATARFQKAKIARAAIADLEKSYKALVKTRLEALESRKASLLGVLNASSEKDRKEALKRAQAEASDVAQQALAALERTALAPETQLPAVPGAQSSVDSRPVVPTPMAKSAPVVESLESLREQLDVFLKVMNYRLVDSPQKGRDATSEFVAWRKKYANAR